MSVYLDVKTKRQFNTLAELKAFQRGETSVSPEPSKEEKKPVKQEVKKETVKEEVKDESPVSYESTGAISISLSEDEMKDELRSMGYDARSYARKTGEDLAEFFYKAKNRSK